MSIEVRCECGADLRLPNEAAGRRARCKHCGHVFEIPENVLTTEVDEAIRAEQAEKEEKQLQRAGLGADLRYFGVESDEQVRGFWHDAALSFVLVKDVHNGITLALLWFLHGLLGFLLLALLILGSLLVAGALGMFVSTVMAGVVLIVSIFVGGYLTSFWFRVFEETAEGEDRWPDFRYLDPWEDVAIPVARFIGTWVVVLGPGIGFLLAAKVAGKAGELWPVGAVLMVSGVFMWPTVMLATALGGLRAAVRIDMHLTTVFEAFFPYVAVWLMVSVAVAVMASVTLSVVTVLEEMLSVPVGSVRCKPTQLIGLLADSPSVLRDVARRASEGELVSGRAETGHTQPQPSLSTLSSQTVCQISSVRASKLTLEIGTSSAALACR